MRSLLDDIDILRSVFDSLAVGVVVCDHRGQLLCFNPEAQRILGVEFKEVGPPEWTPVYGCYLPDMHTPYPPEQLPLARCLGGEEVLHELVFIRNSGQTAGVWISVSAKPFRDKTGAILGGVGVFRDITAAQNLLRTNGAGRFTADAAEKPPTALECSAFLDQLDGLREHFMRLSMAVEQTADSVLITDRRGVIEYVNPAFEETTGYTAAEVLGRKPGMLKSGMHDERFYKDLWAQLLAGKPFRGTIVNRKKAGELYWAEQTITPIKEQGGRITHFVSVLKDVTESRKQQEQEFHLRFARAVQQRFYNTTAAVAGFDIAGASFPATFTGGDYIDFIPQPDGCLCMAIGDVSGHGFGAALVMAETRAYLRAYASMDSDAGVLLGHVNRALSADLDGGKYVTLLLVRLDPRKRSFQYAGAGHIPGYLLSASGEVRHLVESSGPPLGLFPGHEYHSGPEIPVEGGETLVLLTDGITEASSVPGHEFGAGRVLEYVKCNPRSSASELIQSIHQTARAFAGGQDQSDDASLIVARAGPEAAAR